MYEALTALLPHGIAGQLDRHLPASPEGLADFVAWMLDVDPGRRCPEASCVSMAANELAAGNRPVSVPNPNRPATVRSVSSSARRAPPRGLPTRVLSAASPAPSRCRRPESLVPWIACACAAVVAGLVLSHWLF